MKMKVPIEKVVEKIQNENNFTIEDLCLFLDDNQKAKAQKMGGSKGAPACAAGAAGDSKPKTPEEAAAEKKER